MSQSRQAHLFLIGAHVEHMHSQARQCGGDEKPTCKAAFTMSWLMDKALINFSDFDVI